MSRSFNIEAEFNLATDQANASSLMPKDHHKLSQARSSAREQE